ncbi:MAG: hypothetical protein ACRCW2_08725 [Cellulosilyticaceae bacterium]
MDIVPMIIMAILIIVCPRKGTFVNTFKLKVGCIELNMSTKEKSVPPNESEHSNHK